MRIISALGQRDLFSTRTPSPMEHHAHTTLETTSLRNTVLKYTRYNILITIYHNRDLSIFFN
jgi:hypothetical protein